MIANRIQIALVLLVASFLFNLPGKAAEVTRHNDGPFPTAEEPASNIERLNNFILNCRAGGNPALKKVRLENLQLFVQLATPLNSDFNHEGDRVLATVLKNSQKHVEQPIPAGSTLEGYVEGVYPSGRLSRDGLILIRFYTVRMGNYKCDLRLSPNTPDSNIRTPYKQPRPTRKKIFRELLMSASRISIPFAVGTGGISLAITTGACAAIGCVLADDGKHVSGAVEGAWRGCGLAVFDPVIKKGNAVRLPAGTMVQLKLSEPVELSLPVSELAENNNDAPLAPETNLFGRFYRQDQTRAELQTSAHLISDAQAQASGSSESAPESEAVSDTIKRANEIIAQKDLARALDLINKAWLDHPQNAELGELRDNVLYRVTGGQIGASPE